MFTDNGAPQFSSPTPSTIHVTVGEPITVRLQASDEAGEVLTFRASVTNLGGVEQLASTVLAGSGDSLSGQAVYTATLVWTPGVRDTYNVHISVTDTSGVATVSRPQLVLCACNNGGTCDFSVPFVSSCTTQINQFAVNLYIQIVLEQSS